MDRFVNNIDGYIGRRFDNLENYIEERINNKIKVSEVREQEHVKEVFREEI